MLSTARSAPKVTRIVPDGFLPGRQTTAPGLVSTHVGGEREPHAREFMVGADAVGGPAARRPDLRLGRQRWPTGC
ncbi:hypothetical protein FrEUN1fDRAFT_2865 [Parafrankia sp. EUN1f]|nr:hypothetical protein FrEUN1fDRAFT_2865 [Parafrankia sp. EUN1f]